MNSFLQKHRSVFRDLAIFCGFLLIALGVYYSFAAANMIWGGADSFQWLSFTHNWKDIAFSSWQKLYSAGSPSGAFYSINPIMLLLIWLPNNYYVYAVYCVHIAIGAFFTYKYLGSIKCDTVVSLLIGLLYEFSVQISGIRRGHMVIVIAITYLPMALFLVQKYFNEKKLYWLGLSVLPLVFAFYGGHLQTALYVDIAVFAYIVIIAIKESFTIKRLFLHGMTWGLTYVALICPALLERVATMKQYTTSMPSSEPSFDYFASYSMHPIKILDFLFPNMFGYMEPEAFGAMYSSEIDFEIFLGFSLGLFAIYGIVKYWKEINIKISFLFVVATLIYCVCPHIPVLNKIVYHLPVFGGFRCASRALFIFVFFIYAIVAITLSKMINDNAFEDLKKYVKRASATLSVFLTAFAIIVIGLVIISNQGIAASAVSDYFSYTFVPAVLSLAIIFIAVIIIGCMIRRNRFSSKTLMRAFTVILTVTTLVEVYPYSFYNQASSLETSESTVKALDVVQENIGDGKIWEAFPYIDGSHISILSNNSISSRNIQVINSYMALNNPDIYRYFSQNSGTYSYNSSGLMTGSVYASSNLFFQNNFLSMMGIKYVLDNMGMVSANGEAAQIKGEDRVEYDIEQIDIPAAGGELNVLTYPLEIQDDCLYKFEFDGACTVPDVVFTMDFYGGAAYDTAEQERTIYNITDGQHYEFLISSGKASLSDAETCWRILTPNTADISIRNVRLTKYDSVVETAYTEFYNDGENLIYENKNARDILYVPSRIEKVDSTNYVYENMIALDLADVNYAVDLESRENAPAQLSDIDFGNDRITAGISADGDTFVNFSQCFNANWHAYIDGSEVTIYKVNGIIMGINVPNGEHTIEFRYIPMPRIIGWIIALAAILFWIAVCVCRIYKRRKNSGLKVKSEQDN